MIVIKRDSSTSTFSPEKIQKAINKAAAAAMTESPDSLFYTDLLDYIETEYNKEALHIEQIQDAVIKCLFDYGYTNVADKFSEWRNIRDKVRSELKIRMRKDNQNITDKTLLLRNAEDDILVNWDPDFVYTELNKIVDLPAEEQRLVVKNVENRLVYIQDDIVEWELIQALTKNVLNNLFPNKVAKKDTFCLSEDFVSRLLTGKSNENSNVVNNNPSLINQTISEVVLKEYALENVFDGVVKDAHLKGKIYIHDMGFPHALYCSGHSLEYIKKYGLQELLVLPTESSPAKSASVLTGHLNTFLSAMCSNYAGALGIGFLNVLYAPMIRGLSDKEVKQIAQELIFNASQNAYSRAGQSLFLDFNIHTNPSPFLKEIPAVFPGGKYRAITPEGIEVELQETTEGKDHKDNPLMVLSHDGIEVYKEVAVENDVKIELHKDYRIITYADFQKELLQMGHALLDVWEAGDKNGKIFAFPKCDFMVDAETFKNPDSYKLFKRACEVSSNNSSVYFVFQRDAVQQAACCRLKTTIEDPYMLRHPEFMTFCGFQNVTINFPQIAYDIKRKGDISVDAFAEVLYERMELAIQAHLNKKQFITKIMYQPGTPLYQVGKPDVNGKPYVDLESATYIFGMIGLNEAVAHLFGEELHESEYAEKFGKQIIIKMYQKIKEFSDTYGLKCSLEESPAESASRRLAMNDLLQYPEAEEVVKGYGNSKYYTNSVHYSPDADIDMTQRIEGQAKYHGVIESGAITHAFVGEQKIPAESIETLVQKAFEKTQSAQITISGEYSYCRDCKYSTRGLIETCPQCGSENISQMSRIVGYMSEITNWSNSKQSELEARHKGNYVI